MKYSAKIWAYVLSASFALVATQAHADKCIRPKVKGANWVSCLSEGLAGA